MPITPTPPSSGLHVSKYGDKLTSELMAALSRDLFKDFVRFP
ncbi:hypothetical protein HanXRQr2_Chr17g0783531 [Helianthus annuus]|uniref:Uncharacterized protein n=1 Tax=Helianthus annuus TaxID=4232 RepID=A0A9K3GTF3_HELAN|nr:hypothetical protein HanXRQr2_Chr17g0783531 [Helianthus annuus]KAJ0427766.1 hypothetical protein HanHA300_Chr17g0638721 [Helianthus annuus]KAJ0431630.1 hypothetical protein HanIR_Chr17g0850461 [Helianthus annuus]KAJ0446055.1 hypothetical protein HanHA89_Chr17g0690131 [Helianthus annuus]KAJ0811510.1 hypothetical protein HanPSC8_Chr17g0751501 [Helianthus annuus]